MVNSNILNDTLVWDNHTCMPLRLGDEDFLPQLARHRNAGVDVLVLNAHCAEMSWETAVTNLAVFRFWINRHNSHYRLVNNINDIEAARANKQLAIAFDLEGGIPVEPHPGLVEVFYQLGVRWMLIAYNKNNRLGGGCQDEDCGLSDYGREIIDEMERVGMVLCCSHTGYRTAREAMEYASNPVIFSHSNARALCDHERNIPDDLIKQCAATGGVVGINGFGIFLGDDGSSTESVLRHIDYISHLVGPEHVGLGLDYVFDQQEMDDYIHNHPELFPASKGYKTGMSMVEPERIPYIAEGLLKRGYSDEHVKGIMGHNNLRVARQVWK